jgi:hypothetical protein
MKKQLAAVLLLIWLGSTSIVSAALPPAFEAVYRARKAGMTLGEVTITLSYQDGQYHYEKRTVTKGLLSMFRKDVITETSIGEFQGDKIKLKNYHYHLDRKKKSRKTSLQIEGDKASGQHKGQNYELTVPEGTLDRASIELALMLDATKNPSAPISYSIVDKGVLKSYRFEPVKNRKVKVPAGKFNCLQYQRGRDSGKRATTLCLAPEVDNLPIFATHSEKGNKFSLELVRYRHL